MHKELPPSGGANDYLAIRVPLQAARPAFLILSPVCVFLGLGTALSAGATVHYGMLALILLAAICAHIGVNTLNEYDDFRSGLDFHTKRTPFSGGSGALPAHPEMAGHVLFAGRASLLVTTLIGSYFVWLHGWPAALLGLAGIALILTYTTWLNRFAWACLLAPGLGFGLLMVAGTHYLLTGVPSPLSWLAALIPFFLINNLLLLNQYPDIEADRKSGRRHFPIVHGPAVSNLVYGAFLLAACLILAIGIGTNIFPGLGIIALLPMFLSVSALAGALRHGGDIGSFPKYLAANAAAAVTVPLLLGAAIMIG